MLGRRSGQPGDGVVHEYSIAMGLVETALRHAGGRRVIVVSLRVGALRQVVPSTLELAFAVAARGTGCDGARLEQAPVAARLLCPSCAAEWTPEEPDFRCRSCGGAAVAIGGNELQMKSIEVDDEESACTG
jgi:hydrogenase nickel incorporation protein HypA/HybF